MNSKNPIDRFILERNYNENKKDLQWNCKHNNRTYTANAIEQIMQQLPAVPADVTSCVIETNSACGGTTFTVTTNCPQGGDAGHGGFTSLHLDNDAMTLTLSVFDRQTGDTFDFDDCSFCLKARGDEEHRVLMEGLIGVVEALKRRQTIEAIEFESGKRGIPEPIDKSPIDKEALKRIFTEEVIADD